MVHKLQGCELCEATVGLTNWERKTTYLTIVCSQPLTLKLKVRGVSQSLAKFFAVSLGFR
jgi:hypothetical protein